MTVRPSLAKPVRWGGILCAIAVLVGIRFGLLVHRQNEIVQAIRAAGGSVTETDFGPAWLHRVAGTSVLNVLFRHPIDVDLPWKPSLGKSTGASDLVLSLRELRKVERLNLRRRRLSDADMLVLGSIKSLKRLDLAQAEIENRGLRHLGGLSELRQLNLSGTQINDAGLSSLSGLRNLAVLELDDTPITGAGVEHLQSLSHLRTLTLSQTEVSEFDVQKLLQTLPNLDVSDD